MTIKQHGGIFGRNPTFNDVDVDGTLSVGGTALPTPSNIAKLDTAQEFTQEQEIKVSDITAYDATAADAQVTVGPTLFLNNPTNSNTTVAGQVVFGLRSTPYYARLGATGGSIPKIFVGIGTSEIARFTSDGITFNGDTAAANALDDYEEGAFDITITPETSGSITVTTSFNSLAYTKVGRVVHITGAIGLSGTSSPVGSYVTIAGLPFTMASLDETQEYAAFATYYVDDSTSAKSLLPSLYYTSTSFRAYIDASTIQTNDTFGFNFSYIAA